MSLVVQHFCPMCLYKLEELRFLSFFFFLNNYFFKLAPEAICHTFITIVKAQVFSIIAENKKVV